ncbi:HlyD family type I secretion periplasmic adaptor subunit [Alsobacter sp. R-9]
MPPGFRLPIAERTHSTGRGVQPMSAQPADPRAPEQRPDRPQQPADLLRETRRDRRAAETTAAGPASVPPHPDDPSAGARVGGGTPSNAPLTAPRPSSAPARAPASARDGERRVQDPRPVPSQGVQPPVAAHPGRRPPVAAPAPPSTTARRAVPTRRPHLSPPALAPRTPALPWLAPPAPADWRSLVLRAWLVVALLFGAGGLWLVTARLDQGAIAPGVVEVASNRKVVQHLEGGIVAALDVRDGDTVEEGATLLRLDDTQAAAQVATLRVQLAAALAEEARLVAERDEAEAIRWPQAVLSVKDDPVVARAMADQTTAFRERRGNMTGQQSIFEARIRQLGEVIEGTRGERTAGEEQVATIRRELEGLKQLLAKNLVQLPRVLSLEREEARLKGVVNRASADIARYEQSIGEARIQISQLRQQMREQVSRDLPAARKAAAEVREKLAVAQDTLRRVVITAPQAGVVQGLRVFTVGGVIKPGETLMEIVPAADDLVVRAKVNPLDVDTVHVGQEAEIRFPAFATRKPPLILGRVRALSRDRLLDETAQNAPYFAAEITVDRSQIPQPFRDAIQAGMQGDVIIATGERTALAYLLGPLMNRLRFGMRER